MMKNHFKSRLAKEHMAFLDAAYDAAQQSLAQGGIPIGAVLVIDNNIVATGCNKRIQEKSMIKHGEMDCLENTHRTVSPEQMQNATLYTSLSPCFMCAGAILLNKIPTVVVGENKTFEQSEQWLKSHGVNVYVANQDKFISMMINFIMCNTKLWGEDIGLTEMQVMQKYSELQLSFKQ